MMCSVRQIPGTCAGPIAKEEKWPRTCDRHLYKNLLQVILQFDGAIFFCRCTPDVVPLVPPARAAAFMYWAVSKFTCGGQRLGKDG